MSDRRSTERLRTYLGARIRFNAKTAVPCLVRDISSGGARVLLVGADTLPSDFDLDIPRMNLVTHAKVVWRESGACGVSFSGPSMPQDDR